MSYLPQHTIVLNDYQVANLRALIEACGYGTWEGIGKANEVKRNPLYVGNNGDWIGELYQMLPVVEHNPNDTPQALAAKALAFH